MRSPIPGTGRPPIRSPAIVDALDDRFALLGGGRRRAVDRHSTMRATIVWSYRLLDADEQQVFLWLAVFSNGFELDAGHHIAHGLGIDEHTATEHVASLVHKSMVSPESHPHGLRYRMLTVGAFALAQLDERGERLAALTAHAEWVTTTTDLPFDDPCNAAVEANAFRLEREADSWRDAVLLAAQLQSGDLAARLCGPPSRSSSSAATTSRTSSDRCSNCAATTSVSVEPCSVRSWCRRRERPIRRRCSRGRPRCSGSSTSNPPAWGV
ncbi:MAG: hypothetical protein ABW009_15740 [Acidimicrobiales bacterium]